MIQMSGLIDVHAHILPGVDDGAKSMRETSEMLEMAWEQGIREIIATPHYVCGGNRCSAEEVREIVRQVQEEARAIDPEFYIYSGNEVLYFGSMTEDLREGRILTLGDSRYVLVEFYDNVSYREIFQAVRQITMAGYGMVIAHVERYSCLREKGRLDELARAGAFLQMNYGSLEEGVLSADGRWCRRQAAEGRIHLLGTDMHNMGRRAPRAAAAASWLVRKVGEEAAWPLLADNAGSILAGQPLEIG